MKPRKMQPVEVWAAVRKDDGWVAWGALRPTRAAMRSYLDDRSMTDEFRVVRVRVTEAP